MVAKAITRMKNAATVLLNLLRECNFNIHNITGQQEPVKRIKTGNKNTTRYESIQ